MMTFIDKIEAVAYGMLALGVLGMLVSCAHLKPIAVDFGKCEAGELPSMANSLAAQASASLLGSLDAQPWATFAEGDLLKYGLDTGICIVQAVLHEINSKVPVAGQADPRYLIARQLGTSWLAKHRHKP